MQKWSSLIYSIVRPSDKLTDPLDRQRATILASLFILLMITSTFSYIIMPPLIGWRVNFLYSIAGVVSYIPLLYLARSAYYRLGAWLFLFVASSLLMTAVLMSQDPHAALSLNFFMVFILIAGLVLRPLETSLFALFSLAAEISIGLYKAAPHYITINSATLTIGVAVSVLAFSVVADLFKRRAVDSEARFRELMNANTEGILVIDEADARILDSNPAIERILGYSREEIIGRYPIEFLASDSKASIRDAWDRRHKEVPTEAEVIHKDGSVVYIEATLKPYSYLNKKAYVLTVLDVNERKQVEALVIESEKRFRAIFNESSHFIGVLDVKGKILEINEQGYEFFGLNAAETVGRYLWDFRQWAHSPASKERIKETVERASAGQILRYHVEVRDRYNFAAFLDFTLKPVLDMDGSVTMLIADSRDITAYKVAEQKRVEYERRYEALFSNTADAVFIYGLDGKYITANDGAQRMLGYILSEIIGRDVSSFVIPEEAAQSKENIERVKAGLDFLQVPERKLRRKNGEVFSAEISMMMVRDADNKPMYIQSMVRDISERKRMERQRLEMALEKERTKLLEHFIEQASHHFRTPITNLKTSLYLLPRFLNHEQKREEHINVVNKELLRLQNLLEDLLSVLRLQKSNAELSLGKIHLNQFMNEVRSTQVGRDYYAKFDWKWELSQDEIVIIGDKGILSRALLNLLENAAIYTKAGGTITVRSYQNGVWLAIDVIDSGIGIHEDDLPHIFEDFYRTQDALASEPTGSGLGLTISKSIIERHQGTIRVASTLGEGSHFQILLPIYTEWTTTPPPLPEGFLVIGD
jgi:PAS domain S-box-containing protein